MFIKKHTANLSSIYLAIVSLSFLLISCLKNKANQDNLPFAALSIIHAAPVNEKFNIYLGHSLVNYSPLNFGDKVDYFNLPPGKSRLDIIKEQSNTSFISSGVGLYSGKYHSLFIIESTETGSVITEDDLSDPAAGKAKIRFIHLSPDCPPLSLTLNTQNPLFTNKAYKDHTSFVEVDPGSYTIFLTSDDGISVNMPDVEIESGKIYTIWAKGLKETNDDLLKLSVGVLTNK